MTEPIALSPSAAAAALGLSRRSLSRLIASGAIVARRCGKRTLVDAASLRAYFQSLPTTADAPITVRP